MRDKEERRMEKKMLTSNVVVRRINFPESPYIGYDGRQSYPGHPLNFDCLRPIPPNCMNSPLDRAIREVPWQPRSEILDSRIVEPKYMDECKGTPRQEYQEGLVDGIRVRQVFNPYVKMDNYQTNMYNYWDSRDNDSWNPRKTSLRGGRKMYNIPEDLFPYKDELGEWHPPRISGRYAADVRKQYYIHSLPWVWDQDAMDAGKKHFMDREPLGNKRWFRREYRKAKTAEALRGMDALVEEYRRETRAAKPYTWFERTVHEIAGNQIAPKYVRVRKLPKM
ncbi:hypothetical protein FOZ60_013374 [Perkinsus olseni]|uniref:BIR protein n=1 Tax=Perkinsus olseni TaxID=32597 RepID=A0A7J6PLQ4_PEROL|nr:hypothetical protein FOZ60_013374 [Perkinsus olseni]